MYRLKKFLDSFLRALSVLAIAFILVIGSFLVYYFISIKIYEEKGSSYKPAIMLYNIISQSMEPNINVYDVVVDKSIKDIKEIKENDVITFISKSPISYNYIITHRIIDVYETEYGVAFLTKGDNNKLADEALVYEDQILGKMIFKIPGLGKIQTFLAYKGIWLFIVLIPAFGVIIFDIVKISQKRIAKIKIMKKNKKKKMV